VKDEPPVSAFVRLHESGPVHRFAHEAMATIFEVHAAHEDEAYARQAAHAVFALVDRLEQDLSRFVPNSDVSRVNVLAAGQVARVSPATMECLVIAWHMYELTEGAFDVTLGSGLHELELDPDELTVHARSSGVRLDLGGIGKGFAVDRAAALLEEWGVDRALVHGPAPPARAAGRRCGPTRRSRRRPPARPVGLRHPEGGPHPGPAHRRAGGGAGRMGRPPAQRRRVAPRGGRGGGALDGAHGASARAHGGALPGAPRAARLAGAMSRVNHRMLSTGGPESRQ
jgi:hypothetical protein